MIECKRCGSTKTVKNGTVRGKQRYLCKQCGLHFVEGDQRENENSNFLKTLCTLFQMLGTKQYKTIGEYLKRDTSLIFRWMNKERLIPECRCADYSTECYSIDKLFEEIKLGDVENGNPIFIADNIIDDLYVAVIVQRRDMR